MRRSPCPAIPVHPPALLRVLAGNGRVGLAYWHRTGFSRNGRRHFKRTLRKGQNSVHLLATDRWKPFQKFVDRGALVDVLEKRGNGQACALKTPCSAKLIWVPVNSAAEAPIHIFSLSPIRPSPCAFRFRTQSS